MIVYSTQTVVTSLISFLCLLLTIGLFTLSHLPRKMKLKDKIVLITGGSSGIGKAIAKVVLEKGSQVVLVARDKGKLQAAKAELGDALSDSAKASQIRIVAHDVTFRPEKFEVALASALGQGAHVDVLINCAGLSVAGTFDELPVSAFEDMFKINCLGSIYPLRTVLPKMKARRSGSIVFVSSQAGQVGLWGYSAYAASKFALRGLAQALQMELYPYNIFVSVAYPPDTDTPGFKHEELSKPDTLRQICGAGTVFEANKVARDLVQGIEKRRFSIYTGVEGFMLTNLTCGMEPVFSAWNACVQVLTCSLFRLVSLFYLVGFYATSNRCTTRSGTNPVSSISLH